jgi:hypothetical protein
MLHVGATGINQPTIMTDNELLDFFPRDIHGRNLKVTAECVVLFFLPSWYRDNPATSMLKLGMRSNFPHINTSNLMFNVPSVKVKALLGPVFNV